MPWSEVRISPVPRERVQRLTDVLFGLGCSGIQEEAMPGEAVAPLQPWDVGPDPEPPSRAVIVAWFEDADRPGIAKRIRRLFPAGAPKIRWDDVVEVDWQARFQAQFAPIHVSERLVIAPPWNAPAGAVVIEPGQGFGTGDHPTTRQALSALDALADGCTTALDVGCGSGILALAAAKLGLTAAGFDVEEAAVAEAKVAAARNGLAVAFSTEPITAFGPADLVLANLHAELVETLAADLVRVTHRWLVVAGILLDREPRVLRALAPLRLDRRTVDGEWVCLWFRR